MPGKRKKITTRKAEPAMIRAGVVAVLGLLATLGFQWANVDNATLEKIVVAAVVLVPLAQGLWTRYGVVARGLVLARLSPSTGVVVAGEAATARTDMPLPAAIARDGGAVLAVELDPALQDA